MNEAETRADYIDPALAAAGWGTVASSQIRREYSITLGRLEGHGRRGKALSADYVLQYRNTKLGFVEAKAWDLPLTEGVGQAKDYADKLKIRFTYATNGHGVYGIDMQDGTEGELPTFPTPEELWNRTFAEKNAWRDRFAAVPFEDRGGYFQGRYYQDIAIDRVLESIAAGKDRQFSVWFVRSAGRRFKSCRRLAENTGEIGLNWFPLFRFGSYFQVVNRYMSQNSMAKPGIHSLVVGLMQTFWTYLNKSLRYLPVS